MKPTESTKEIRAKKATLRASLPDLLKRSTTNPEAAKDALQACAILRRKPPRNLLTEENISRALSPVEISKSLGLLSELRDSVSLSTALTALRTKDLGDRKTIVQVSNSINSFVAKIVEQHSRATELSKHIKEKPLLVFSESTVVDAAAVILWIVTRLFELPDQKRLPVLPLALKLIRSLEQIWRCSSHEATSEAIVRFFHSLGRNVKKSVYGDLEDDLEVGSFIRDAHSTFLEWTRFALLDGCLNDLQNALGLAEDDERTTILSKLQETCRTHSSQVHPQIVEWVAQQVEKGKRVRKPLVAADRSQSSDLDYVAVSLLDAWDAALNGERAGRALTSMQRLARELFNVDFANIRGEVVHYDERQHEISPTGTSPTSTVEVVRPGIQWSDGTRIRFLVRALVRPIV